ncbi:polyprenyl synthetase family protein [Hydromonas duriensis]|uniref:Farnesyl-diphosphate synthase n=1 Tax=Hydromonas duriensis TaxID=1527608 RepID=A0A4R6Y108_9BURK|nr:farnesyl diphosphate synthase [Hydromonas duriensis]TDR28836.1 farnesyl-diphosphate synthase [Hydromonas duriensis]
MLDLTVPARQTSDFKGDAHAFSQWAEHMRPQVETHLAQVIDTAMPLEIAEQSPLKAAMAHGLMNGGKRVRALAALAAGQLFGAEPATLLKVASALECIHAYSLIHDDLPCMDDDDLRRGQPTVHVKYGEAMALLAGDALQTLAFSILSAADVGVAASVQVKLLSTLAQASGAAGMAGGQAIDCHHVGQAMTMADMQRMHRLKTGALLQASLKMGALCGQPTESQWQTLDEYAQHLGLLFQVVDDILDATQDSHTLGKTAGKDERAEKPTYVRALGLEEATRYADDLYESALRVLQVSLTAQDGSTTESVQRLADLAAFCAQRVN